jgi:DNA invertase Pin-like site-specific DNA recombinase
VKKIAIYYRVSTERQDFASQKNVIDQWLSALPEGKKPQSISVYEDDGISGKTMNRPG